MTLSRLFLIIAAVLFFLAAVGAPLIPNPTAWGLFFLTLGFVSTGIVVPVRTV
jgi:hypothetical protein